MPFLHGTSYSEFALTILYHSGLVGPDWLG